MKKTVSLASAAALLLAVVCLFTACGKAAADKTVDLSAVMTELEQQTKMPAEYIDLATDEDLEDYYGLDTTLVKSFAIRQNASGYEDEIVLLEAADEAGAETLAAALEQHRNDNIEAMRNYSPDMFTLLNQTSVDVHGRYVTMFVSNDAENMKAVFDRHLAD